MIIKISKGNGNWHFIGEIEEVSVKIMAEHELPTYNDLCSFDSYYQDYEDRSKLEGNQPMPAQIFHFLSAKSSNGKNMAVCTDQSIFLLNNEGKTIERL